MSNYNNISIHPTVVLTMSEYFNRMQMNFKCNRVFGGLIGEISGNDVELFTTFEFLDKRYYYTEEELLKIKELKLRMVDESSLAELDINFIKEKRKITEQLYPNYNLLGFYSVGNGDIPDDNDYKIYEILYNLGIINQVCIKLNNNLIDKDVIPLNAYYFDYTNKKFKKVKADIRALDSERICIDTVTKSGGVQNNESQIIQNMETFKDAINMLKFNLKKVAKYIELYEEGKLVDKNNKEEEFNFHYMLNDIVSNYPNGNDKHFYDLINSYKEDMLIANNICSTSVGINYYSKV